MDHIKILKRAFEVSRTYHVLWIFGFLLALTGAGRGNSSNVQIPSSESSNWTRPFLAPGESGFPYHLGRFFPHLSSQLAGMLIAASIGLVCLVLLLVVVSTIVRYVSETALIRLVDNHESSGEKASFRLGWKMGWSRSAFDIFLIDLLIGIAVTVVFLVLIGMALVPMLVWLIDNTILRVLGTAATIGLGILVFFLAIVVGILIALIVQFIRRACILEQRSVFESMRRGYDLARQRLLDVFLMGVFLFVIGLGVTIVMIPVMVILLIAGVIIAGLPALMIGAVVRMFMDGATPWILAALFGLPIFMLILTIPTAFLGGLVQVFSSSTWTLTFRELTTLEGK